MPPHERSSEDMSAELSAELSGQIPHELDIWDIVIMNNLYNKSMLDSWSIILKHIVNVRRNGNVVDSGDGIDPSEIGGDYVSLYTSN